MRALLLPLLFATLLANPALAQDADPDDPIYTPPPPPGLTLPVPPPPLPKELDAEPDAPTDEVVIAPDLPPAPDYSALPPRAEREARLAELFERLSAMDDTAEVERAKLVSEEIWALWTDSGSASVNYLLVRADAAQRVGELRKTRRFLDQMTALAPDYAEGYARSARLALDEENYNRAIADATQALTREPRHFYALWTLGNVLERLGKTEEALDVYREANALFPLLGGVKTRLDALESSVLGDVL